MPEAEAVGPGGSVVGVDVATALLALARAKCERRGLRQVELRREDMLALPWPDESFDAVVCIFGVFFVPDMRAAVRELWRAVRRGGTLAITTWGPRLFEPLNGAFWDAVRARRPELDKGFHPWDRIATPAELRALLEGAGVLGARIEEERGRHPIATPEDAWSLVLGSGYRGTLEQLTDEDRRAVRDALLARIEADAVREVEANVIYARARKP